MIIALAVIDILLCIAVVALVIMQEGNSQGLGTIGGAADTFWGKSKGSSMDAVLKKITTVLVVLFVISTITLYYLTSVKV